MSTPPSPSRGPPPPPNIPSLRDVIIIGAGPCGLAVAARLCEHTPSAIFTDDEHARYHWIRKHGRRMSLMRGKRGCIDLANPAGGNKEEEKQDEASVSRRGADTGSSHPGVDDMPRSRRDDHRRHLPRTRKYDTLVLDATADRWMAGWNRLFKVFDITHLRSPMFFHVDPRDRDGLLAYTYEQQRKDELREIKDCVGKEVSKHRRKAKTRSVGKGAKARLEIDERDRKDYYIPSRSLFDSHCECIVNRYGLNQGLIKQESVLDIDFSFVPDVCDTDKVFTLRTDKATHYTRAVVMAVGAGNTPTLPPLHSRIADQHVDKGMCHSNKITEFPHPRVQRKIENGEDTNVVVVGGGLTSAQLVDLAIRRGVSKVWHIMRSDFKVKPFDVNLEWMGKFKNHEKAIFWSADSDAERLEQIRSARNGGSITPPYAKALRGHQATQKLKLHTRTTLASADCAFDPSRKTWRIATTPAVPGLDEVEVDYVYFATGVASDFARLPFLQTMLAKFPLHGHGGFPCLSEDLMWRGEVQGTALSRREEGSKVDGRRAGKRSTSIPLPPDEIEVSMPKQVSNERVPLFVTGRLASLRLGPGGGNLEGARIGAERIAWALQEIVDGAVMREEAGKDEGLRRGSAEDEEETVRDDALGAERARYRYAVGIGSRFESLGADDGS